MDEKDRDILEILENNGRASYTEIADEVGVSEGTVRNRVERMKEKGVIRKFTVETGERNTSAVVMVRVDTGKNIENVLESFPNNLKVKEVAGDQDLILELSGQSTEDINESLDKIREVEGVNSTKTFTVLKERHL